MKDPQFWQTVAAVVTACAALLGGIYVVVTRPLMMALGAMQGNLTSMQTSIQAQLTDITTRLGRIEAKLDNHEQRISALEAARWK